MRLTRRSELLLRCLFFLFFRGLGPLTSCVNLVGCFFFVFTPDLERAAEVSSHTSVGTCACEPRIPLSAQIKCRIHPSSEQIVQQPPPHLLASSVHKPRSVVECLLLFPELVSELCFCQPIKKSAAAFLHPVRLRALCCAGIRARKAARICLSLPHTLNSARPAIVHSAHTVKCETCWSEISGHSEM